MAKTWTGLTGTGTVSLPFLLLENCDTGMGRMQDGTRESKAESEQREKRLYS